MPNISFERTTRQMGRAKELAQQALESTDERYLALKTFAPDMIMAADSYISADSVVELLNRKLPKELQESQGAIDKLARLYDEIRPIAESKAHFNGQSSSSYATDDDFLEAAEDLENTLTDHQGEDWTTELLPKLTQLLDASSQEYTDLITIRRDLQKAQVDRAESAIIAREILLPFRRIVRATFGSTSREYHDIKDPVTRGDTESETM